MYAPIDGDIVLTQLYGSTRGGPSEAYTTTDPHGNPVTVIGHPALDISCPLGTPVRAAWPGKVVTKVDQFLGTHVIVTDGTGRTALYAHLSQSLYADGEVVKGNEVIALSGFSGNVQPPGPAGAHLHMAVKPAVIDWQNGFEGYIDFLSSFYHDVYQAGRVKTYNS